MDEFNLKISEEYTCINSPKICIMPVICVAVSVAISSKENQIPSTFLVFVFCCTHGL